MKSTEFDYELMCLKYEVRKLESMLNILKDKKSVSLFHAQKSLYVNIEYSGFIKKLMNILFKYQLSKQLKVAQDNLNNYLNQK